MTIRPLHFIFATGLATVSAQVSAIPSATTLTSPDGRISVKAGMATDGRFSYSVSMGGRELIAPSPVGLEVAAVPGGSAVSWDAKPVSCRKADDVWKPLWGKRASVADRYQEAVWCLRGTAPADFAYLVTLRVYDDGMAFRYTRPEGAQTPWTSTRDLAEFRFSGDFTTWGYNGENHNHGPEALSAIQETRPPVIVLRAADDAYLAVHEADLTAGEPLRLGKSGPTSLRAEANFGTLSSGQSSPWRVVLMGTSPGALVDSHLIELLNPPSQGDFSWVKPGVTVWDWRIDGAKTPGFNYGMNYPSWVRMVDFAAKNGMQHLVLDANWYGPEFAHDSDPVKGDKAADVRNIIAYAKQKHIGVWLYLNDVGGRKFPLEQTLAHYGEWGAAGVKYGFMKGTPEEKNLRTRTITELCAKHKLLCNFHDGPVHPYGQMRTWPNAVTREYCWAQLDAKKVFGPKTFVTAALVNQIAGPVDMNNGMFDLRQGPTTRVDNPQPVPSTVVSEAARTLITFSGATILPDVPEYYQAYPELLQFIAAQQQPWAESKTLSGIIGEHVVTARKSAKGLWLLGAATNEDARRLSIPLSFLGADGWDALIIEDGRDAHYLHQRETFQVRRQRMSSKDTLQLALAPGGGACVLFRPAAANGK